MRSGRHWPCGLFSALRCFPGKFGQGVSFPIGVAVAVAAALVFAGAVAAQADIAVIVALESQAEAARSLCVVAGEPTRTGGRKIAHAFYEGEKVHIVKSGAGLVPTAQTTTLLLARYPIDFTISYGLAGGLADDGRTEPGTTLVADDAVQHNLGIARDFGTSRGPRPGFEPEAENEAYRARLERIAARTAEKLRAAGIGPVAVGTLCSGDEFIASESRRAELRQRFDALAVDMNATGIALPCRSWETPYVMARRITDRADAEASLEFAEQSRAEFTERDRTVLKVLLDIAKEESS